MMLTPGGLRSARCPERQNNDSEESDRRSEQELSQHGSGVPESRSNDVRRIRNRAQQANRNRSDRSGGKSSTKYRPRDDGHRDPRSKRGAWGRFDDSPVRRASGVHFLAV